jgi:mRNA-degrading endonuclease toxin of MazEF toxin-antitoxin module
MKIKSGDIWLVKFHPGTGSELSKYRPAVVLSCLESIDSRFTLIAPLTSDTQIKNDFEFQIKNEALEKPSVLLGWYLWTIDSRRLVSKIGVLKDTELEFVLKKIQTIL